MTLIEYKLDFKELEGILIHYEIDTARVGRLGYCNLIFALNSFFEENNINNAKQYFYNCSLLDAYRVINYQDRLFDYDLHSIGYAMLSDNLPFIKDVYANLTYSGFYYEDKTYQKIPVTMEDNVLSGESAIFVHTIQQFIKNETELIERNLNIMETLYIKKNKAESVLMKYDIDFFKALHNKDKAKCESILDEMTSPVIHKKRNDDALLKKYISMPALGYAKLAWLKGVEVEVKSKLIPKELLPISPLEKYEIPYNFLK